MKKKKGKMLNKWENFFKKLKKIRRNFNKTEIKKVKNYGNGVLKIILRK